MIPFITFITFSVIILNFKRLEGLFTQGNGIKFNKYDILYIQCFLIVWYLLYTTTDWLVRNVG